MNESFIDGAVGTFAPLGRRPSNPEQTSVARPHAAGSLATTDSVPGYSRRRSSIVMQDMKHKECTHGCFSWKAFHIIGR